MDIRKIEVKDGGWFEVAQDLIQWCVFVNKIDNVPFSTLKAGNVS
jgi:hypothetical protein